MLRRIFFILTLPLAAVITFAAPALAASAHLKGNHQATTPCRSPITASR